MKAWIYLLLLLGILAVCWFGPVIQTNWERGRDAGALFYTDVEDFGKILKDVNTWRKKAQEIHDP